MYRQEGGNKMTYDALMVARYVINYSNEKGYSITNLKLQKILYFIQAIFLKFKGEKCFNDDIQAWDFGPVVPSVYHEFKKYGNRNIATVKNYFVFSDTEKKLNRVRIKKFEKNDIVKKDRIIINLIVDTLGDLSASELVKITHEHDAWKNAYKKGRNTVIALNDLYKIFEEK